MRAPGNFAVLLAVLLLGPTGLVLALRWSFLSYLRALLKAESAE